MVIQSIREFNRSLPFVPYEIHMASGERYQVPHPDFISISPRGHYVIVIDAQDRPHHLSALLIERASPARQRRPRRSQRHSS
jgi:hypothetical protein